jgi:hypothetical protein
MKFNINNLESKLDNISLLSGKLNQSIHNVKNKNNIEIILNSFLLILEYEFNLRKQQYLNTISGLSLNYLIGSEWYLGEEYTYEHFFDEMDENVKYKIYLFMFIINYLYKKL